VLLDFTADICSVLFVLHGSHLFLPKYCALVPVVEGAGGVMTDWCGRKLTLQNHEESKGRVVACANRELHRQAVAILGQKWNKSSILTRSMSDVLLPMTVGICLGIALSRSRS
jgi:hypothetical protein